MNPHHHGPPQQQPHSTPQRAPPQKRRRGRDSFRWEYILIPLMLLGIMWILADVDGAAFSFEAVMDGLRVKHRDQYRQLATLGLVAVAIVWVTKILKSSDKDRH